jgi:hypothetical protein
MGIPHKGMNARAPFAVMEKDYAISAIESSKNSWRPHHQSKVRIAGQHYLHGQDPASDINNAPVQTMFLEKS